MTKDELQRWNEPVTKGELKIALNHVADMIMEIMETMAFVYTEEPSKVTIGKFQDLLKRQREFLDFISHVSDPKDESNG